MSELKIAVSRSCPDCFSTQRSCVNIDESNFIDVAAIVLSINDIERGKLDEIDATGYGIPVFIATEMKNVFHLNICRGSQVYSNVMKPVPPFMAGS